MKLALALLLLAAPLSAQAATNQNIVVNVVVTLVKGGTPTPTPTPTPVTPPVVTPPVVTPAPVVPPPPPVPPAPVTPTPVPPAPTSCVNTYPGAAKSMADVTNGLVQAEQLYATALSQKAITAAAYASGVKTLSLVNVDNSDVRDLIRIGGPPSLVAQNLTFVSAEIGTLPGLLGTTTQLKSSLTTLTTSMQASLGIASTDVTQSTCPKAVP